MIKLRGLQKNLEHIEHILDSITDGFFTLDKDFNIKYVNKAFLRLCHLEDKNVIGMNYWEVFPKATSQKFFTEYSKALKEETSVHFEEYANSLDKWVMVAAYPLDGGLSVYFSDITDLKKHMELVESQNEQLKSIAWMLSHKIRRPVASVLGLSQLINKKDPNNPDNVKVIEGVVEALEELDDIIKEIDQQTKELPLEAH